jgi:hypothetical protein
MINRGPLWNFMILLVLYTTITFALHLQTWLFLLSVGALIGIAYGVIRYGLQKMPDWKNYVISGCILYLLYNPAALVSEYLILVLIVALFFVGKFVRYQVFPYVNPIVFAFLATYAILAVFGQSPLISWWGASYLGSWSILWLAPTVVYGMYAFRRPWLSLSYILSYGLLQAFAGDLGLLFVFGTGTIYFVAGIMLLEPKTSPITRNDQLLFGIGTGILTFFLPHIADQFLVGIALMNVAYMAKKRLL